MNVYSLRKTERNETNFQLANARHEVSLVEGEYSSTEAQERLMRILLDNISYHSFRSFNSVEKTGQPDDHAENKVEELEAFREKVYALAQLAKKSGKKIDVQAKIKVKLV